MKKAALLIAFMSLLPTSQAELNPMISSPEGVDVESPEQIARAAQAIQDLNFVDPTFTMTTTAIEHSIVLDQYAHLDPKHEVPTDLLAKALLYFDANKTRFPNQSHITIVDFKPRSNKYRLFLINMASGAVEKYHTTHGLNSDKNRDGFAESFGNVNGSGKSSLGPVRTGEVYHGKFKRAVRLDGLASTNSNIRARAIVLHGWDGVKEKDVIQGLSWGCITLDWKVKDSVIDRVKEGSLIYVDVSSAK